MSDELEMTITNNNLPLLGQLEDLVKDHLHAAMKRIGAQVERCAVMHIQNQDLNWEALSPGWLEYKKKHEYSNQIYIMTSSYQQNITWQYTEAEFKVEVGVMRSAMHVDPETGKIQPLWKIAEALEYGYEPNKLPARPLWRPVLEENRRSAQTIVGIAVKKAFEKIEEQATRDKGI